MAGLRPTRQRVLLASLLFNGEHRHVNAERLHADACAADGKISLATVYNTLHQFCEVGLLRQIAIDSRTLYFDTNTSGHHHFYFYDERRLEDIPVAPPSLGWVPEPPEGTVVTHIDILVRVRKSALR